MAETVVYRVPGMHCGHCTSAVEREVGALAGVESVRAELERKTVTVHGDVLDDAALRAAIAEAGYEVE
jgi:copper chaperone